MSDKLAGGIKAGSVSVSLPIELRKAADSTSLTGIVFGGVTASFWRQGGVRVAITPVTLGSVNAAFDAGGFVEVDATNMPGLYRFDVPDAAFAPGADWVVISLKVATAFQLNFMFALETAVAAQITADHGAGSYVAIVPDAPGGGGSNVITVTVTDGVNPLQNANVRLTEGINTFSVLTDVNGVAMFALDAATYGLSITKDGYQYTPDTLVVDGPENFDEVMTVMVDASPPVLEV